MSAVTLKTSITAQIGPFGLVTYYTDLSRPATHRIAVPLTTVWSLAPGCTEIGNVYGTCAPPNFIGVYMHDGYYSPGVCYSGYTIGCTVTATSVNLELVKPSETAAFCVPSGYTCQITSTSGYMAVRYAEPTAFPSDVGWGLAVQIRWQSSDSAALGSLFPTPTASTQPSNDTGALPTGAIVGIVVGAVTVLALILFAVWVVFRHRRRYLRAAVESSRTTGPGELDTLPASGGVPVEVPGTVHQERAELASIAIVRSAELPRGSEKPVRHIPGPSGSLNMPCTMLDHSRSPGEETVESLLVRKAQLDDERNKIQQRLLRLQKRQPPVQRNDTPWA